MILGEKCVFYNPISKSNIRKKSKISLKGCSWVRKLHTKFLGNTSTNNIVIANLTFLIQLMHIGGAFLLELSIIFVYVLVTQMYHILVEQKL